ncbi:MAG: ankyrin repeat domain-containing protein [Burkholderiales bacterium]|nr:MAG: ankyrin repeat domain-containing protein [Burkholderiales bacterium]
MPFDFGADIQQRGHNDYTPLRYAAYLEDLPAIELLMSRGADPDARTRIDDRATPLEEAEIFGRAQAFAVLKDALARRSKRCRLWSRRLDVLAKSGNVAAMPTSAQDVPTPLRIVSNFRGRSGTWHRDRVDRPPAARRSRPTPRHRPTPQGQRRALAE